MAKQPSFQFYPGDWLKDTNLRFCSATARGYWMDMLCLAFGCDRRGIFKTNGRAWTQQNFQKTLGISSKFFNELLANRVLKRSKRGGVFYVARMVRDERISRLRAVSGRFGGRKRQAKLKQNAQQNAELCRPPSSVSSSSSKNTGVTGVSARALNGNNNGKKWPVAEVRWVDEFCDRLSDVLNLDEARAEAQRASFAAMGYELLRRRRPDFPGSENNARQHLETFAREAIKQKADDPVKVVQAEFNNLKRM